MQVSFDGQEQSSYLQDDEQSPSPSLPQNSLQEQLIRLLLHLKQNRIFYFMVGAGLLVLVVMLQIRTAYRAYDDNERLVKLWVQEKELKDIMSHKSQPITDTPQIKAEWNRNRTMHKPTLVQGEGGRSSKDAGLRQINPNHQPLKTAQKLNNPPQSRANSPTRNSRPIAGISRVQVQAVKRWHLSMDEQKIEGQNSTIAEQEGKYYQQKYNISHYKELPFCVVVPSYNNVPKERHFKNMRSILMQNYTNYHIVFIDDASTDGTGEQIGLFMQNQTRLPAQHFKLIINPHQMRAMPNLRMAAKHFCRPEEIFLIVDGDDELIGRQVLKLFSAVFQQRDAWFVYSNFLTIRGNVGYSRPFPEKVVSSNTYRKYPFVTSHLRAFYTELFLNVKEEDLQSDDGEYLRAANDVAICIPILEQAHTHTAYIKELTYFYNSNTGLNNHQLRLKEQKSNDRMLRKKKPYEAVKELTFRKEKP